MTTDNNGQETEHEESQASVILSATIETSYAGEDMHISAFLDEVYPIMITIESNVRGDNTALLTREMASGLSKILSAAVEITPDTYKETLNGMSILGGNLIHKYAEKEGIS